MPPPPIDIGWVNDAPAPVLEIVSGADETTEVSVVGKFPETEVPFAFTPGADDDAGGAFVVDETTEASSVAKWVAALAAGEGDADPAAMGDGSENPVAAPFC